MGVHCCHPQEEVKEASLCKSQRLLVYSTAIREDLHDLDNSRVETVYQE